MSEKPRYVEVKDPEEQAIIRLENETGRLDLPRGGFVNGKCWAVAADLERYREAIRLAGLRTVAPEVQP